MIMDLDEEELKMTKGKNVEIQEPNVRRLRERH